MSSHMRHTQSMCLVCCKELRGWCKSFTRTEGLLSILEALLLVVLISFLVFLILHFVVCGTQSDTVTEKIPEENTTEPSTEATTTGSVVIITRTLSPDVECTWEPSHKTSAATEYYLTDRHSSRVHIETTSTKYTKLATTVTTAATQPYLEYDDEVTEPPDGELAHDRYKGQVVALVKLKPLGDITFGCILTKITKFWTVTAASCIESIEEVDSLDSFVMIEEFGEEQQSRARGVADVRLHPRYQGRRRARDLAALRSDRALRRAAPPLRLPTLRDHFLLALGESFLVLGYGGYRTVDKTPSGRRLRQAVVFAVSSAQCGAADSAELWAPRHLTGGGGGAGGAGGAVRHGACGAAPTCAGARAARGAPCNYCAGAPLVRAGTLYGIMSDNSACAVSCEPQLYVNLASLRDWIDSVIE